MKADIRIRISHTARENNIPEKTFERDSTLRLELPLDQAEFTAAVEALVQSNFTPVLTRLCDLVVEDSTAYCEALKKAGIQQLNLPFSEEKHDG